MLLYGCFYIVVSGPLIQYLKTFSFAAELQPLRASPTMSFPQTCRSFEAGQGGGLGCGPEQLAATVPCACVYSGCIAMAIGKLILINKNYNINITFSCHGTFNDLPTVCPSVHIKMYSGDTVLHVHAKNKQQATHQLTDVMGHVSNLLTNSCLRLNISKTVCMYFTR